MDTLQDFQVKAIQNIRARALLSKQDASATIRHVLRMSNVDASAIDDLRQHIVKHGHIAVHFHPDRPVKLQDGFVTVAESLALDGVYRSQFETSISNGLVSTVAGGPRDQWEENLFGGAYHEKDMTVSPKDRPKYGALDLIGFADGPAPRFGSTYFVLKPEVSSRATFTYGGSQDAPKDVGTIDEIDSILSALLEESFIRDGALGFASRPAGLLSHLQSQMVTLRPSSTNTGSNLDHVIEAQIHGEILLSRDVEALVVDGSFAADDDKTGMVLREMGARFGFPVLFTRGFRLDVASVPLDFRGPTMPSLAKRISASVVDAKSIGVAAQSLQRDPERWSDRGTYAEVLQELKLLWHVLVRFG